VAGRADVVVAIVVVGAAVVTVVGAIVVIAIVVVAITAGATVVDATAASGVEELDDGATEITLCVGAIVEGEDTSVLVGLGPTTVVVLAGTEPAVGTAVVVEPIVATGTTTDVVVVAGCAVVVVAATPPTAAIAVGVLIISALTNAETVQRAIGATSRDSDERTTHGIAQSATDAQQQFPHVNQQAFSTPITQTP
jgi:hypothetical protein